MKSYQKLLTMTVCLMLAACGNGSQDVQSVSGSKSNSSLEDNQNRPNVSSESSEKSSTERSDFHPDNRDYVVTVDENGQIISVEQEASDTSQSMETDKNGTEVRDGLTYVNGILLVNKKHGVPQDYAPGVDPTAQSQCNALLAQMMAEGFNMSWETSNYRSYDYQSQLYNNYVAANGQASADTFSARPGFSEHQTGLAFDLKDSTGALLTSPVEAQWLLDHSWEYGFIVRYQEGKEAITGYQAEPWHIRYVGDEAEGIARSGLTLEEYLNAPGGDYR